MAKINNSKKRVIVSYQNLPVSLQEELKRQYPHGYTESMMRVDKGPGDFFYAVVLDTEDIIYLVKIDVKIDGNPEEEEEDKDFYDEGKDSNEIIEDSSSDDEE